MKEHKEMFGGAAGIENRLLTNMHYTAILVLYKILTVDLLEPKDRRKSM